MFIIFMGRCVMLQVAVTHACMISNVQSRAPRLLRF